jgi:hypothetical protein
LLGLLTYSPCPLLQTLIDLHGSDEGLGGKLTYDEIQIICGTYPVVQHRRTMPVSWQPWCLLPAVLANLAVHSVEV